MVDNVISQMVHLASEIQEMIKEDLEDVKKANHEGLSSRNDDKLEKMTKLVSLKEELNMELAKALQSGEDLNIYRDRVNTLEEEVHEVYDLNTRLANVVLPLQVMYKELVEEFTEQNGGLVNLKA
jgi:hypothetical protein